jgi:hypothetical protein
MRTETNGNIKVTLFDEVAYDREKNLVLVERLNDTPTWVDVYWGGNIDTVRYYFDQTDKITIDWSDIIRVASGGEVNITAETSEYFSFEYTVKQGVIPMNTIEPPQVIWNTLENQTQKLELITPHYVVLYQFKDGVWTELIPLSLGYDNSFDIQKGTTMLRYALVTYDFNPEYVDYSYILIKPQVCGVRYVLLKWLSSYGNYKQQIFEVEERATESTERQEKATMTNNYSVLKNRVDSLTVIMRDISAHDIEYYSDLVTSNEVFILTETKTDGVYLTEQVDVQTKKITIPNGVTQKYDFKIDIKHRHYDLF